MADRKKTDERKKKKQRLKNTTKNRNYENAAHRILMMGFVIVLLFVVIKGAFSFIDLKAQQKEAYICTCPSLHVYAYIQRNTNK